MLYPSSTKTQKTTPTYQQVTSKGAAKDTVDVSTTARFKEIVQRIQKNDPNFNWTPTTPLGDYPGAERFFLGQKLLPGDSVHLHDWLMADQSLHARYPGDVIEIMVEMQNLDQDFVPTFDLRPPPAGADKERNERLCVMMICAATASARTFPQFVYNFIVNPQTDKDLGSLLSSQLRNENIHIKEISLSDADGLPGHESIDLQEILDTLTQNRTIKCMHATVAWLKDLPSLPASLEQLDVCGEIDASGENILTEKLKKWPPGALRTVAHESQVPQSSLKLASAVMNSNKPPARYVKELVLTGAVDSISPTFEKLLKEQGTNLVRDLNSSEKQWQQYPAAQHNQIVVLKNDHTAQKNKEALTKAKD